MIKKVTGIGTAIIGVAILAGLISKVVKNNNDNVLICPAKMATKTFKEGVKMK